MVSLVGGCLCGKVRYSSQGKMLAVIQCHCKNCQKQSGSAFSINIAVKMDAINYDRNALTCYVDTADSGRQVYRYFCAGCGSPIFSGNADLSGVAVLKAGTLDDTGNLAPTVSIWEASAQPWVPLCENVEHFNKGADQA